MLRLLVVLGLSLALHFILYGVATLAPRPVVTSKNDIAVELIEKTDNHNNKENQQQNEKPVVKVTQDQEPLDLSRPADFVAEKNQRFEKQTKAQNLGVFKNAENKIKQKILKSKEEQKQTEQKKQVQKNNPTNDEDLPEFAQAIQSNRPNPRARNAINGGDMSSVPYQLPSDIAYGAATNLNADAHIYASFYNRILDLFYIRWAQRLDALWNRMPLETKKQLSGKNWITEVEIQLNEKGVYQKGLVMKYSGFPAFDQAGIGAFQEANYFPNPPKAKVDSDGLIRLRYRIAVQVY